MTEMGQLAKDRGVGPRQAHAASCRDCRTPPPFTDPAITSRLCPEAVALAIAEFDLAFDLTGVVWRTHDYTTVSWGHACGFRPERGGDFGRMHGWGRGIADGDYIVFDRADIGTVRYRVGRILYCRDPREMWFADVASAPVTFAGGAVS